MGLVSVICATNLDAWGTIPTIVVALVLGGALGAINGSFSALFKLESFVVTLATLNIYRGLAFLYTEGRPIFGIDDGFRDFFGADLGPIPKPILFLLGATLVAFLILDRARSGVYFKSIGTNELAARKSGVAVERTKILAFTVCGVFAGLGALLLMSRIGAAEPISGTGYELTVIAAVVVGGTSLMGGRATVIGTVLGALLLGRDPHGSDPAQREPVLATRGHGCDHPAGRAGGSRFGPIEGEKVTMSTLQFSTRLNSFALGKGKKLPSGDESILDLVAIAGTVNGLTALELNYPEHFRKDSVDDIRAALDQAGLVDLAIQLRWPAPLFAAGAFTNVDPVVRANAVELVKEAVAVGRRLGSTHVLLWPAHDGYEYPLQMDYPKAWPWMIESLVEVAEHAPDVRFSIEYKPADPRGGTLLNTTGAVMKLIAMALRDRKMFGLQLNDAHGAADDGCSSGPSTCHRPLSSPTISYARATTGRSTSIPTPFARIRSASAN